MRLLLDTHTIIWYFDQSDALSANAREAIRNPDNEIFVSVVSLWELSIKVGLGKLKLPKAIGEIASELQSGGAIFVPISEKHAMATGSLPWHHRDPFDRMLIAQAQLAGLTLVSRDSVFGHYDIPRIW